MKLFTSLLLFTGLLGTIARADTIPLGALGDLAVDFAKVVSTDTYPGRPLSARASFRQGEAVNLVTPYAVRQIRFQHPPGALVARGDIIARLAGPEIHHFMTEFTILQSRLASASRRYERNRELYERQAIDESTWLDISDSYYALRLEHEHMRHFYELLEPAGEDDALWLKSPASGLLQYRQPEPGLAAGQQLALIIPQDALRLRVSLPIDMGQQTQSLRIPGCTLAVESLSGIADDYFIEAWSAPLTSACQLLPGQRVMARPLLGVTGYLVPRSALIEWQGKSVVLMKAGTALETVLVQILGSVNSSYFVTSARDLSGREVLSTSASAVQGMLNGLGGE
ncbi:HlyD family secretion protein [Pseudohalioglobus sediminis]|uniref:HlyD family secretion protein n=1 Tax=Pseudohalioglobus sediminis TaxID=2606449 RepID=A0A5B0X1A5_9GAMM|nr:HlyD family secretion protein [Pseudohalioglobus sediminis]KAA1193066.1 HlyD family secretion protein [Pseudohalioglobus sediminis]